MAVVGSLVGVRLLTGLIAPAAYGELALGMTVATLVNQVVLGPIGNGVMRNYAPALEKGEIYGYFKGVQQLVLLATGTIALFAVLAVSGLLSAGRKEWVAIAVTALLFATLSGYNSILNGIQNAARQRAIVALHSGMVVWVRYLIAAVFLWWLGSTSTVVMEGYCVATLLVLGSQYLFFRRLAYKQMLSNVASNGKWLKHIWNFSWPYATFGIFTWMQLASDRWALGFFSKTQDVGKYSVLYQLGYYPMIMANSIVAQMIAPIFYQRAGDGSDLRRNANVSNLSWRLTGIALCVTGIAFFVAMLVHIQIFRIVVAKEYRNVSYLLPWMLLSGGVYAAGQTIELNLSSQMKINRIVVGKIITAITGVLLNLFGAYLFGIKGIVIASISFAVFYFVWMAILSKQLGRENLIFQDVCSGL